jgi:hypothetical protein
VPLLKPDKDYFKKYTPDTIHDPNYQKDYYDHTYAIIDLNKAKDEDIPCEYYNVKASYLAVPPLGKLWFKEQIPKRDFTKTPIPGKKAEMNIKAQFGVYIRKSPDGNWPVLGVRPSPHTFNKCNNTKPLLEHGDDVKIIVLDKKDETNKFMTAFWDGVRYTTDCREPSTWTIEKPNYHKNGDPLIYYRQTFYLKSRIYG